MCSSPFLPRKHPYVIIHGACIMHFYCLHMFLCLQCIFSLVVLWMFSALSNTIHSAFLFWWLFKYFHCLKILNSTLLPKLNTSSTGGCNLKYTYFKTMISLPLRYEPRIEWVLGRVCLENVVRCIGTDCRPEWTSQMCTGAESSGLCKTLASCVLPSVFQDEIEGCWLFLFIVTCALHS